MWVFHPKEELCQPPHDHTQILGEASNAVRAILAKRLTLGRETLDNRGFYSTP
jgi:hypothetical protein